MNNDDNNNMFVHNKIINNQLSQRNANCHNNDDNIFAGTTANGVLDKQHLVFSVHLGLRIT